ncbi:MAG: Xaa-Pro peptidase family protein [Desulfocapsaceae bacterium]|nr:Xaa-Pro peptidase family protein [Desulfocapsaceae bacterium]
MEYQKRIEKIQRTLRRQKLDAVLIGQPANRRYLCGYSAPDHGISESAGMLLVPADGQVYLLTDFRFELQAKAEAPTATVLLYPKGLLALLLALLPDLGIRSLGFESDYTLHSVAGALEKKCAGLGITTVPLTGLVEALRLVKEEAEIDRIRASVALNEAVFQEVYAQIRPGQTELELAIAIETCMRRRGAEYPSFETIVATGSRSALPHAVPGQVEVLENQPLMIDMGLVLNGYCSDMTRTFPLGKASDRYLEIHRLVRRAQLAGIKAIRAGVTGRTVDQAARQTITDAGYGQYFGHALGHGVGIDVHEDPRLSSRSGKRLKAGMVVTVEPGIYIPGWGGVRLENMVVVGNDGCEVLNSDTTWLDI